MSNIVSQLINNEEIFSLASQIKSHKVDLTNFTKRSLDSAINEIFQEICGNNMETQRLLRSLLNVIKNEINKTKSGNIKLIFATDFVNNIQSKISMCFENTNISENEIDRLIAEVFGIISKNKPYNLK